MSSITIDNSKESSTTGAWSNPGASMYDRLLEQSNYKALLKEAYLLAPVGRIKRTEEDKTSFSASGMGYPHHVIRGDKLVLHRAGLRAAFSRGQQQGVVSGEVEAHLVRHYKELGWYKESTISEDETKHSALDASVKMGEKTLKHYGILGMKWGHRRDRGSDGLVEKRRVSDMTTEELQQIVSRMNLEKQYKQLTTPEISKGQKIANELLLSIGKESAKEIAKSYTKPIIESLKKPGK